MKRYFIFPFILTLTSISYCFISQNGNNELCFDFIQCQMYQNIGKTSLDSSVGSFLPETASYNLQADIAVGFFNFVDYFYEYFLPTLTSPHVDPYIGNPGSDFVFTVKYTNPYNDPPANGYTKLILARDGVPIIGSPFSMTHNPGGTYIDGLTYSCTAQLTFASNNYSYYFVVYDSYNFYAQTSTITAPVVHNVPILSQISESPTYGVIYSSFVFNVTYRNPDNFPPVPGDPKIHIIRDGSEIITDSMAYISGLYDTGAVYRYVVYGLPKSTYSYFISAEDSLGYGATSQILVGPIVNDTLSQLSWTGETNYVSGGIYPLSDVVNCTYYFKIKYSDIDNDPPAVGYPKLHILNSGLEILSATIVYSSGVYNTGAIYAYSIPISTPGSSLSYYFEVVSSGTTGSIISSSGTFSVFRQPSLAVNTSKAKDGDVVTSGEVVLSWESALLDVSDLTYYLYLSAPYAYNSQSNSYSNPNMTLVYSGTNNSYTLNSLESGKKYYWRADIGYGDGFILSGPTYTFKTLGVSDTNKVFNYPNPFNPLFSNTGIVFYADYNGKAEVKIYSEFGDFLFGESIDVNQGSNEYSYNGRDYRGNCLLNGTYLVVIKLNNSLLKGNLMVLKR